MVTVVRLLMEASLFVSTTLFAVLNYRRGNRIADLEQERELLRRKVHKISSKINPESDRNLLLRAEESLQIIGINSLGPLHHCREEIIDFLVKRDGYLQLILLDPASEAFADRERQEEDSCRRLLSEWQASLCILKDIRVHATERIELRLRTDWPDRSLFIVDSGKALTDRSKILINYYPEAPGMRGYSGAQFLAEFVMERDRDSVFKNREYFLQCWQRAGRIDIDAAIDLGRRCAAAGLP